MGLLANILAVVAIILSWHTAFAIWLVALLGLNLVITPALRRARHRFGDLSEEAKLLVFPFLIIRMSLVILSIVSFFH